MPKPLRKWLVETLFSVSTNYTHYESGKHYPSFETLVKLSKIFGTSIDYIMGLSDQMTADRKLSAKEEQLLYLLQRLDENKKEKVLAYMQGIAEQ